MGGWIEALVFAAFALGWGVIELVALSLDRKRHKDADADADTRSVAGDAPARADIDSGDLSPHDAASAPSASPGSSATKNAATTESRESP